MSNDNGYAKVLATGAASSTPTQSTFGTATAFNVPEAVAHPAATQAYEGLKFVPSNFSAPNPPKTTQLPVETVQGAGGIAYHKVWRQQQLEFSETSDQANWGYW